MKLQALVASLVLAVVSAAGHAADGEAKPAQPHSHMQEKTGIAPPAATPEKKAEPAAAPAAADKAGEKKAKNKKRHLHPRDGK